MREPDSIACKQYRIFKQAAGKTAKSILVSVGVRLAAFNLPSIATLTMTDELHLQELGERKIALFCCIPDSDKSLNYLVGMIYTTHPNAVSPSRPRTQRSFACACALPYGRVRQHFLAKRYLFVGASHHAFLVPFSVRLLCRTWRSLKPYIKTIGNRWSVCATSFSILAAPRKKPTNMFRNCWAKETISTTSYNQSKGRSGSYSINHQQSGRDMPYLFVKSSVALNFT